jgi:hypothetical protein
MTRSKLNQRLQHRYVKQAKETDRLEPKGTQSGLDAIVSPKRERSTAGVESGPKSSNRFVVEHGREASGSCHLSFASFKSGFFAG